jgi:hypothetical protein
MRASSDGKHVRKHAFVKASKNGTRIHQNRQISLKFEQKSLILAAVWLQVLWLSSSADTESTSASQSAAHSSTGKPTLSHPRQLLHAHPLTFLP